MSILAGSQQQAAQRNIHHVNIHFYNYDSSDDGFVFETGQVEGSMKRNLVRFDGEGAKHSMRVRLETANGDGRLVVIIKEGGERTRNFTHRNKTIRSSARRVASVCECARSGG